MNVGLVYIENNFVFCILSSLLDDKLQMPFCSSIHFSSVTFQLTVKCTRKIKPNILPAASEVHVRILTLALALKRPFE